jgi:hypothetical protein
LNKKLTALGKKNAAIKNWQKAIVNHLWYCCATCNGDEKTLLASWESLLKHVKNIHTWTDKKKVVHNCAHEPLTEDQLENTDWIEKSSDIEVLRKVYASFLE